MINKGKKAKLVVTNNSTSTDLLQFESVDIHELESYKNQIIEDQHKLNNTPFEKKAYGRMIAEIEEFQLRFVTSYYHLNGNFPDGVKEIVSYIPKPEIHNQDTLGLNIEEWSDLEIRIGLEKATFYKISSKSKRDRLLSGLNWDNKNIKIDALRILANGELKLSDFVVAKKVRNNKGIEVTKVDTYLTPEPQSIKNELSNLRKDLYALLPELSGVDPIEYRKKNKQWTTPIKIILLDGEEKRIETEIEQKYSLGFKGMKEGTYNSIFRDPVDTHQDNRSYNQDKLSEYLPNDKQEDDNGY